MTRDFNTEGFTLVEMVATVALIAILAGAGLPLLFNAADAMKLGESTREVEREIQIARMTAVSSNQPMRVRFDCPSAGSYQIGRAHV